MRSEAGFKVVYPAQVTFTPEVPPEALAGLGVLQDQGNSVINAEAQGSVCPRSSRV